MRFEDYARRCEQVLRGLQGAEVEALVCAVERAYADRRTVFLIGNGGSAANASHLCQDLAKGTLSDLESQKRLKVIALTDCTPAILAWANDEGFDRVFVEQLRNLGESGDLLIAVSGSGNSLNCLRAAEWARAHGLRTFAVTGFDGGRLLPLCEGGLRVPCDDMGLVEAVHGVVFHYLVAALRERFAAG